MDITLMHPLYWAVSWILIKWAWLFDVVGMSGVWLGTNWDWVLAIIFLTITVRLIIFPLFVRQIHSQRAMQALQPEMKKLQEKHKGDRETLQKEMMELYRREKANPLMGCLPILLQMPVFLGVFFVVRRLTPSTTDTTRFGWTTEDFHDAASAKLFDVPISATFNAGGWAAVLCGILGVIMILTTYWTSKQMILKTGWAEDPTQKMMQRLMLYGIPATLIISAVAFPLGLIIYWTVSNIFSLGQQMWVLRKYPPPKIGGAAAEPKAPMDPAVAKALAPKVGAKPTAPAKKAHIPAKKGAAKAAEVASSNGNPANGNPANGNPAKASPAKATPAKASPAKATPAKASPAKTTPAKAAPTKAAATKAAAATKTAKAATPSKATPAKAAPQQAATPAESTPAQTTAANSTGAAKKTTGAKRKAVKKNV